MHRKHSYQDKFTHAHTHVRKIKKCAQAQSCVRENQSPTAKKMISKTNPSLSHTHRSTSYFEKGKKQEGLLSCYSSCSLHAVPACVLHVACSLFLVPCSCGCLSCHCSCVPGCQDLSACLEGGKTHPLHLLPLALIARAHRWENRKKKGKRRLATAL